MREIIKLYNSNSVSVHGKKGRGKDMLQANVIARRKNKYYISNVDYKCKGKRYIKLDFAKLSTGNTYRDFLNGRNKQYIYPYPDKVDIYISDCGIYFPAQYCNELNRDYKDVPVFMALSRQLGECGVHTNAQYLGRVWDKIREQSDTYITCLYCKVIGKVVLQKVRIHEKYESALNNVPPFRVSMPLFAKQEVKNAWKLQKEMYYCTHGKIKDKWLIYINRSDYDTREFKTILEQNEE